MGVEMFIIIGNEIVGKDKIDFERNYWFRRGVGRCDILNIDNIFYIINDLCII